jgi:CopA family copper-resistance protein
MKRRDFLQSSLLLGGALGWQTMLPAWAQSGVPDTLAGVPGLQGNTFDLTVAAARSAIAGERARHITLNGQFPAPLLRWREGDDLTLRIHNTLDEPTSIHWHGILLPWQMDGVPGVSFAGIAPGETFTYRIPVKQAGTYWYHSHSGLQEQIGHYGPIIIDPREAVPYAYDREYIVLLSDWSAEKPERVFSKLKKMSSSYNYQQRTVGDFFRDARANGLDATLADRMMWGDMRMSPADLADVTAATYTYLVNGHSPAENWTALFTPGERIRLRFINASAMSIFNIRIPGLPLTVVQADGLDVQPVETDEFQIGTAETYDVIVEPRADQAYAIYAESNDRYGYAAATLAPRIGMQAQVPELRARPLLTMKDMGMDHSEHAAHTAVAHSHTMGVGVASVATNPVNRLHERPLGLESEPHRVLVYTDLRSLAPNPDLRAPQRELELKFSEVSAPIPLQLGERVRLTFVNDTMMPHPLHLHGMFFDVVTDAGDHKPRKHTLLLKPGEVASVDVTADAPGQWAFHCHLLYHMQAGMMRTFFVGEPA